MISAPNRRQRLSGSKAIALGLAIIMVYACKSSRQLSTKPPADPTPPQKEEMVTQYDPVKDTVVLVPRSTIKVDTLRWTEDKTPPIVSDEPPEPIKPTKNDLAQIALLIPFNAMQADFINEHQDPKLHRFIQYYSGVNMALRKIDSLGLNVKVNSFDAEASGSSIPKLLAKEELKKADVIVGPYDREDVEAIATYGLTHEVMVVSPWLPAFTNETENPFLIQMFPGLNTHAQAIMEFIRDEMPDKKVYVVARDNATELNRVQLFKKIPGVMPEELLIKDKSPDLLNTNVTDLLSDDKGSIFILPYYSKSDETFVNSFLRKLHADTTTREAIVFGLPQWTGYTNLNPNYMESLNVHLSTSSFLDVSDPEYQDFKTRFFYRYHVMPDLNAFLGYDLMMWLARQLTAYGQEGLIGNMDGNSYGLASGFDIRPVYKSTTGSTGEMNTPLYYENRRIRIIRFVNQDFKLVR